jgi:hypothetical protein
VITRAWLAWKRVAHGIGTFRARGVLTSYFVVMLPFGIVFVVLSIWAWGQSSGADRHSTGPSLCLRTATSFLLQNSRKERMNCQRDKSDKGSRELYPSGLSNYSSTESAKGKNRTPLSDVGGDRTFGNYGRLLG